MKIISQFLQLQNKGILANLSTKKYTEAVKKLEAHFNELSKDINSLVCFRVIAWGDVNEFTVKANNEVDFEFSFLDTQSGRDVVLYMKYRGVYLDDRKRAAKSFINMFDTQEGQNENP